MLKNFTQEHLALEANISQSQLSKYESGESVPNADMLRKMAKVLNVEVFGFFYDTEKEMREAFDRWLQRKG
ncbi:MAG: helix-turn-helix domain-containing protein [Chitinophagaceae bacterium]|nr:helix-turn-helix domain-containing protein [Chitinophagaceae bacterium]